MAREHGSRLVLENHRALKRRMIRLAGPYEVLGDIEPWGDKQVPLGTEGWITDIWVPSRKSACVQYRVMWRGHSAPAYVDCMCVEILPEVPDIRDLQALEEWLRAS